jgi:ATP-binding cassette, subfamily B, bacterial
MPEELNVKLLNEPAMIFSKKFPEILQLEGKDCGPTCIQILCKYYGRRVPIQELRIKSETTRSGSNLNGLQKALQELDFECMAVKIGYEDLRQISVPVIVYWRKNHFVVVYKTTEKLVHISDPEKGLVKVAKQEFIRNWTGADQSDAEGVALAASPLDSFYDKKQTQAKRRVPIWDLFKKYKSMLTQIFLAMLVLSVLEASLPLLTRNIVDQGIQTENVSFIYLAAGAYLAIFLGMKLTHIFRNWIVLHMGVRMNVTLISEFIRKLAALPVSYFDSKLAGDVLQRIDDQKRIQRFMIATTFNAFFSVFNILLYSVLLAAFHYSIFLVFVLFAALHILWVTAFLRKRKKLDGELFSLQGTEKNKIIEIVNGMQEIKINNAEEEKLKNWREIRDKMFGRDIRSLKTELWQAEGASVFNELKNLLIIIIASLLAVNGVITVGTVMSISFIVGMISSPFAELVTLVNDSQEARLSYRRLQDVQDYENEENPTHIQNLSGGMLSQDLVLRNVTFKYFGAYEPALRHINLRIPRNKVTAIVGSSGSGKTTLLKLLLGFYNHYEGDIMLGDYELRELSPASWRGHCGTVMQEGYIFNDSIRNNIVLKTDDFNPEHYQHCIDIANLGSLVNNLSQGDDTPIGSNGADISTGQKQRILIARAVYKDPRFLFLDEATSALDANNERAIVENLNQYFANRTVLVIAHRLSTVKNADNIIVLENGEIREQGTHDELIARKNYYYKLIRNQLELGQ